MIQIAWAILNIGVLFYFLYLCYKALALVKEKLGYGTAIFLFVGLCSISGNCNADRTAATTRQTSQQFTTDTLSAKWTHKTQRVVLSSNPIYSISLFCIYKQDIATKQVVPVSASCIFDGYTGGVRWDAGNISIFPDSSGTKLEYDLTLGMEYQLLNFTVLQNHKTYDGILDPDEEEKDQLY